MDKRIVIIDDDYTTLDILSDFFEDYNYTVLRCASIEKAKEGNLTKDDIFIVDIMIDEERTAGVDFVLKLTDKPEFRDTKFIFISNFGKRKVEEKLNQLKNKIVVNYNNWFDKPVLTSDLLNEVEKNNG
ncbi:MAG: response regulator [Bacteroidales bacterium]|nr:response regulator [Bacteroidales bacterium]